MVAQEQTRVLVFGCVINQRTRVHVWVKDYDLMDDLLEADVLKIYRQVLTQQEAQVKTGDKVQFGYLPRMTLVDIVTMNVWVILWKNDILCKFDFLEQS